MITSGGRGLTDDPLGSGAEEGLSMGAGGLTLGLMGTYPIALNNPGRLGNSYNKMADTAIQATSALNTLSAYKDGLGLLNPYNGEGQTQAVATTSPKNLLNVTFDALSFLNPVTAGLNLANNLTKDEEDAPFGNLPGMKQVAEGVNDVGEWLDGTWVGEALEDGTDWLYQHTIGPVMNTEAGRFFFDLAELPLNVAQGTYRTVKELGEFVDRTVFGGYLPGLAKDDDPQSQQWNNPFKPLSENYGRVQDKVIDALTTSDEEAFTNAINEWAESENPHFEHITAEDIPGMLDMWDEGLKGAIPDDAIFYKNNPGYIPEGSYYNPKDNILNQLPGGDRWFSDPQDRSETGLGYTYVPDGYTFDPDIGLVRSHDFDASDFIPEDTNDYSGITEADKKVMDLVENQLTAENQDVMRVINENARQSLADNARLTASINASRDYSNFTSNWQPTVNRIETYNYDNMAGQDYSRYDRYYERDYFRQ